MLFDFTSNGTLADEAATITAISGIIFGLIKVWQSTHRNATKLDVVVDTLNRVDEEVEPGATPSVGQRLVRIERQVDSISDAVLELTGSMTSHIIQEEKKADRIERRLTAVEDTLEEIQRQVTPDAPPVPKPLPARKATKRTPRSSK